MKRLFFSLVVLQCCFFGSTPLVGKSITTTPEEVKGLHERELLLVDEQIESLTNLRNYYASKAARYRDRADRYTIRGGKENQELAKDLSVEADQYKNIVEHLDKELSKLENQREAILKESA